MKKVLLYIFCFFLPAASSGQDNTLYHQHTIPQSILTNPAIQSPCRMYIELPVISSMGFAYDNSGFGYHDAIRHGEGIRADSMQIDFDNLEKTLQKKNQIRESTWINLLGAGFFVKDVFIHFNASIRSLTMQGIPGDLIRLGDGNWDPAKSVPRDISLTGFEVNSTNFLQIMAGVSKGFNENLVLGARIKYLKGSANVSFRKSTFEILTTDDPIELDIQTDFRINASFPVDISYDTSHLVESANFENSLQNPIQDYLLNKNYGLGLDLGMIYEYDDNWTFSASMIDLGFFRWRSNVNNFESRGEFVFRGFDFLEYRNQFGDIDFLQVLGDSLVNAIDFAGSKNKYTSFLPAKIFLGAQYKLNKFLDAHIVHQSTFVRNKWHPSLTVGGTFHTGSLLDLAISTSWMNNRLGHLGFVISTKNPGPRVYFATDNIPVRYVRDINSGLLWPYNARTTNFRFGVNLVFGCHAEKDSGMGKGMPSRNWRTKRKKVCPAYW